MPRELIITADDYGLTSGVNRGIEACVHSGAIKSVCVMTNMPHWQEVRELARGFPEVSIGIHWNVTQGRPALAPSLVPLLLDTDGEFLRAPLLRRRLRRGGPVVQQLAAELAGQLTRLREAVASVDYWNTHQNVHVSWRLYEKFARIGKSLGIRAMRSHRRLMARGGRPALGFYALHPVFWLKGLVLRRWAAAASRLELALPVGRVVAPDYSAGHVSLPTALQGTVWEGAAELVTHPAANLNGLASLTTLLGSRLAEYEQLSEPDFPARLAELGIDLVNFDSVAPNRGARRSDAGTLGASAGEPPVAAADPRRDGAAAEQSDR